MLNYSDDTDRWKFLSKELALKQEVINRTKTELRELSDQLMEKGKEMVNLREENFMLDQEVYSVQEQLQVEMQIANQQFLDIPKDIVQLPVHELRSHLLSASSAYLSLLNHNKSLKDKLQQVALQVQDLEKVQEELLQKQNS